MCIITALLGDFDIFQILTTARIKTSRSECCKSLAYLGEFEFSTAMSVIKEKNILYEIGQQLI